MTDIVMKKRELRPTAPAAAVTWVTDFNDVDAQGQVIAEPEGAALVNVVLGRAVQLTDGAHFCQAVVTRLRPGYILARPNWKTWQSESEVLIEEPTLTYQGSFLPALSTA